MEKSKYGRAEDPFRIDIETCLSHLSKEDQKETLGVLTKFLSRTFKKGELPETMLPLVNDIICWKIENIRNLPYNGAALPPESIGRMLELTQGTMSTLYIPPRSTSALFSLENRTYLTGDEDFVEFEYTGESVEIAYKASDIGDFIRDEWPTLAIELMIEILTIILIFVPGGHGAKEVAEEIGKKAAKNRKIRIALRNLLDDIMNYGTRGRGAKKLRKNLQDLFTALTEAELFKEMMTKYLKGLTKWQVFWLILDILLAFTPVGWAKKGAELGLAVGGLTYHIHHKHATWKKHKQQS